MKTKQLAVDLGCARGFSLEEGSGIGLVPRGEWARVG